jgi:hypothetical protein
MDPASFWALIGIIVGIISVLATIFAPPLQEEIRNLIDAAIRILARSNVDPKRSPSALATRVVPRRRSRGITYRIGCFPDPPMHYYSQSQPKDGTRTTFHGPVVRLVEQLFDELNLSYRMVPISLPDLLSNDLDIVSGLCDTPYRRRRFDFSDPIYKVRLQGVRPAALEKVTVESLKTGNTTIIVQENEIGWEFVSAQIPEAADQQRLKVNKPTTTYGLPELLDANLDWIAVSDEHSCLRHIRRFDDGRFQLGFRHPPDMFGACVAVAKGRGWNIAELNRALFEIRNRPSFRKAEAEDVREHSDTIQLIYEPQYR